MNHSITSHVQSSGSAHAGGEQLLGVFKGHAFAAAITMTEMDMRERTGMHWPAKGLRLSRSHVVLRCRRMCHMGRKVVLAIHLIDSEPTPLMGHVVACEYLGNGEHGVAVKLMPMEDNPLIADWVSSLWPVRPGSRRARSVM